MFKHYFEGLANVELGPVISLVIFFTFFVGLIVWVKTLSGQHVSKMSNLPLEEQDKA
ncbi:hypothetical protein FUAX_36250 [Fulvitalea axinellae]|uniref:CcoQ/FixQ family Cbb3-type cytochrome c oxidase assembly chaperone n=1 Tax=Fulvitalea axinellae TaxID=1182444 RepID=A0AAU9CT00_9BACT|nr:hypothetical protein FUAX_36250 [Fulvitalea axinellae]